MALTGTQPTTLKNHILANTNTAINVANGQPTAINALPDVGDNYQRIADWYNAIALVGDNQPLAAPLLVWRPSVSVDQLNAAIDWTQNPAGADQPTVSNAWLKWQTMLWGMHLDLTDTQVRQGVATVWGGGGTVDTAIKAKGCGRQDGTRLEVLLSPVGVGGGRVSPVFGYRTNGPEISNALLNG